MPYDNIFRISDKIKDFEEYHHRRPNVLIMGKELQKEMDLNFHPITFLSELERVKCLKNSNGLPIFRIVAFTDDIEGFVMMYATFR